MTFALFPMSKDISRSGATVTAPSTQKLGDTFPPNCWTKEHQNKASMVQRLGEEGVPKYSKNCLNRMNNGTHSDRIYLFIHLKNRKTPP